MENPEIVDMVIKIVREELGVTDEITAESSFVDDLGADSVDMAEMVIAFEKAFGIEIKDETAETMTTIGKAAEVIEELLKEKALWNQK